MMGEGGFTTNILFEHALEIHFLELPKIKKTKPKTNDTLYNWLLFLKYYIGKRITEKQLPVKILKTVTGCQLSVNGNNQ